MLLGLADEELRLHARKGVQLRDNVCRVIAIIVEDDNLRGWARLQLLFHKMLKLHQLGVLHSSFLEGARLDEGGAEIQVFHEVLHSLDARGVGFLFKAL